MDKNERRKYLRVDTSNLLECCCLDENEKELDHCMVKAIDVSPAGVKIESFQEIESRNEYQLVIFLHARLRYMTSASTSPSCS
jgi:hypothetical protein